LEAFSFLCSFQSVCSCENPDAESRFFGAFAGAFLLFARFENPVKKAFLPAFDSQPVGFRDRNLHKKNREFY
ncbi:hypothetical protein, partial [Alistipes ihumii]